MKCVNANIHQRATACQILPQSPLLGVANGKAKAFQKLSPADRKAFAEDANRARADIEARTAEWRKRAAEQQRRGGDLPPPPPPPGPGIE